MSTSYNDKIAILEIEYQLDAQRIALKRVELECLRMKQKIEEYDITRQSLLTEIKKSESRLSELKGGE